MKQVVGNPIAVGVGRSIGNVPTWPVLREDRRDELLLPRFCGSMGFRFRDASGYIVKEQCCTGPRPASGFRDLAPRRKLMMSMMFAATGDAARSW